MKLMIQILMLLLCLTNLAVAQNVTNEYGPNNNELLMSQYDKDPSAEAVVISDTGESYFRLTEYDGFEVIFERNTKIKILSKAGLKWSEFSIPYYREGGKSEIIKDLKGATFNQVNGATIKTELQLKNTFEEKVNENWYNKKFALPDVKEGSVITVSYTIESPYLFNFRNWEFQYRIPVIYSSYTTKMIPFYEYRYIVQGISSFSESKSYVDEGIGSGRLNGRSYKTMAYNFVMKDVPAFKDESYITSINDYIIKMEFQLSVIHRPDGTNTEVVSTWPKLSQELSEHENFGKYIKNSSKKCKEIVEELKIESMSALEKAKTIDEYIKSNFNWNGRRNKYASGSVKELITGKTGNAGDINLFLIGMLNAAGIEADPVILSTRSNGKINADYPFLHFFNYVVALANIGGKKLLLDATEPFCVFSEIPARCINDKGFIIQKNKVEWVDLKGNSKSETQYNFDLTFNTTCDSIIEDCKLITTGYDAIRYRNRFIDNYKDLKTDLLGANSSSADSLISVNLKEIENPFEILFNSKSTAEKVEDKIIISPFCGATITENPLKQPTRSYPVDMVYRNAYVFKSEIKIPAGYKLLEKPDNYNMDNPLAANHLM